MTSREQVQEQRERQNRLERMYYEARLKTRILDIQYKQRASQAKSQEEAEHLFNTYNTQYDTIERIYFTQLQQVRKQMDDGRDDPKHPYHRLYTGLKQGAGNKD